MKLLYITSLFLALLPYTHAEVCKGTSKTCDAMGFHKRKIKNTVFCLECDEFSERKREITCDDKVYTHSGLIKDSSIPICVPPTAAPSKTPTVAPTLAPTSTPFMEQFKSACESTDKCNVPKWHFKQRKITTRGKPICTKAKLGKNCRVSKQGKNIVKGLKKNKN
jgi:hypothetical protein